MVQMPQLMLRHCKPAFATLQASLCHLYDTSTVKTKEYSTITLLTELFICLHSEYFLVLVDWNSSLCVFF